MRIIYGVCGEGLGHVFEAIETVNFLQREGHIVKVITYGDRAHEILKPFNPTNGGGVLLYSDSEGFSLPLTIFKNLNLIGFYIKNWRRLKKEIVEFKPDVFISAF